MEQSRGVDIVNKNGLMSTIMPAYSVAGQVALSHVLPRAYKQTTPSNLGSMLIPVVMVNSSIFPKVNVAKVG